MGRLQSEVEAAFSTVSYNKFNPDDAKWKEDFDRVDQKIQEAAKNLEIKDPLKDARQ